MVTACQGRRLERNRAGLQLVQRGKLQRRCVGRLKDNPWSHPLIKSLLPPRRTKTPPVAGNEPGKLKLRTRRAQIISPGCRIDEEILGQNHANRVHAVIPLPGMTISIPVVTGPRFETTGFQFSSQYVSGHPVYMASFFPLASGAWSSTNARGSPAGFSFVAPWHAWAVLSHLTGCDKQSCHPEHRDPSSRRFGRNRNDMAMHNYARICPSQLQQNSFLVVSNFSLHLNHLSAFNAIICTFLRHFPAP